MLPFITLVSISDDAVTVTLVDGRVVSSPLAWYPRLMHAAVPDRNTYQLIGQGQGIHWPTLDEDVSLAGMLAGSPAQSHAVA
jgi:hypothetical protein